MKHQQKKNHPKEEKIPDSVLIKNKGIKYKDDTTRTISGQCYNKYWVGKRPSMDCVTKSPPKVVN